MALNAQSARSKDGDLFCVSFINMWLKKHNSRCSPLCLSGNGKFTQGTFKDASYLPQIHSMILPSFHSCFMIWWFVLSYITFIFPVTQAFRGIVRILVQKLNKSFSFNFYYLFYQVNFEQASQDFTSGEILSTTWLRGCEYHLRLQLLRGLKPINMPFLPAARDITHNFIFFSSYEKHEAYFS